MNQHHIPALDDSKDVINSRNSSRFSVSSKALLLAAISSAFVGTVPSVSAQGGFQGLEEIIVTARRKDENLQEVPIAVTAMGEDFLRKQSITQIEDLGTKVPSLRITGAGASLNEPLISLRGQRPAEPAFNQDQAVPIYFNDIVIAPTQGSNLGMYDLQAVQVLKGPQGTLFGRNSTGGALLLTPKQPGTELGGYLDVKAGNYDLITLEGAVDIPVSDSFQMRIAGRVANREGYQENVADNALKGDTYGDEDSQGVRFTGFYDGDIVTNSTVVAFDQNDVSAMVLVPGPFNTSVGLGFAAGLGFLPDYAAGVARQLERDDPWKVETDVASKDSVENTFFSNTTEISLDNGLTIKNIFGYREVEFETATDVDGTSFFGWGTFTSGAPGVTTDTRPSTIDSEFISNELQLLGVAMDGNLDWILGFYWSETDATQDYLVQQAPGSYDTGISNGINTSTGIFGEGTYSFSDQLSLTVGLRQSNDEREITVSKWTDLERTACRVTGPDGAALDDCARTVDEKFDEPTWRVALSYLPSDFAMVYGSASTGYRAGGFNTRGTDDLTLQPFNQETVTTYELGSKLEWNLGGTSIRTNLALYWQDYEDIHHTRSFFVDDILVTRTENAAAADISGFEADITVAPTDSLVLNLAYSFVDAEYQEKSDLIGGVEVDTSGNEFPYIPEQSLTASVNYSLPVSEDVGTVDLSLSYYWQDEMASHPLIDQFSIMPGRVTPTWTEQDIASATEYSELDAYSVWNARVDWRNVLGSNIDFAAFVNNATDEEYILGGLNVLDSGGYASASFGAPRTFGASVRFGF